MRAIEATGQFKRDYKRELKGRYRLALAGALKAVVLALQADQSLPPRCRDHALVGDWADHRDCHIKSDLVSHLSIAGQPYAAVGALGLA
jgi:mRNA interferase YafQ